MVINYGLIESKIGYEFNNKTLLLNAFTHASFSNERKGEKNNERLEFLGDSVLGFVVAEYLYNESEISEGKMTFKKQGIVSSVPLATACEILQIEGELLVGENVTVTKNLRENLIESLIGAIYLDGGIAPAKSFIITHVINAVKISKPVDYKSELNEYASKYKCDIKYVVDSKSGMDNAPIYTVSLYVNEERLATATVQGKKQLAEKEAAKLALQKLNAIKG